MRCLTKRNYNLIKLKFDQEDPEEEENILNMEALNKLNQISTNKVLINKVKNMTRKLNKN
jgi:hypothetical protein